MQYSDYANKAWYALRRTLPPWCWEENLKELVECCPQYGIDEVIVKVDTEEFSHHILPLDWLKQYRPVLQKIKEELDKIGVVFSINPWVTLVHGDRGRNCRQKFPEINFMVGHDGAQCIDCACPLSGGWRKHTAALWKMYAETRPDTIWVEDDIRTFNHLPAKFGCFCDEHLERFSQKIGEKIRREQLVKLILQPGKPHACRGAWLDLQAEIMIETAGILEKAVHSVSPATKLGLMSSGPANHAVEGRQWPAFAKALSGPTELVSRPPLGNYTEGHLKGLYPTADSLRLTRYVLPARTIELAEVENCPFTQYNKSTTFTFLQSAVCFSFGAQGLTMNLFDHCGTPMRDTVEILENLKATKPYLMAIQEKCSAAGKIAGIRILHHDKASRYKYLLPGADYPDLTPDSYAWETPLQALGFATTYEPSAVLALSGQTVRSFDKNEIMSFLSGGILCDLSAAQTLQEMGYGEYLGMKIKRVFSRNSEALAGEHYYNREFGGQPRRYFSLSIYPEETMTGELQLFPGAIEVSELVDPDAKKGYPGLTLFQNSLGGRSAVYPFDMNYFSWGYLPFLRPARQVQMAHVLRWLHNDNPPPLFVEGGHNVLPFRMDYRKHTTAGVFCLSLDDWKKIQLHLDTGGKKAEKIEVLHEKSKWRRWDGFEQKDGRLIIRYDRVVDHKKPVLFAVTWENS